MEKWQFISGRYPIVQNFDALIRSPLVGEKTHVFSNGFIVSKKRKKMHVRNLNTRMIRSKPLVHKFTALYNISNIGAGNGKKLQPHARRKRNRIVLQQ